MSNTATKTIAGSATSRTADSPEARRPTKRPLLLVTADDSLWPQIGGGLGADYQLKQVDSIDELLALTPAGQAAIVVWDARGEDAPAGALSRMQLHSARYAIIAIAESDAARTWQACVARGQLVAFVPTPLDASSLGEAVALAAADAGVRPPPSADGGPAVPSPPGPAARKRWLIPAVAGAALLTAAAVAYLTFNSGTRDLTAPAPVPAGAAANAGSDEKVFRLLESAEQAMRERHYIDPAAGSALALYRQVLVFDPSNEEAHQGMQRLAEVLFSRVDSALDEHKFEVALQSLETARSIDPGDSRLAAIDARIASMRSEFGPGQIQAAIAAQAFDRAEQLIDEAVRARALTDAKAAPLRDEVTKLRKEAEIDNFVKLIDARLQQDRLTDPRTDSASYYLDQARRAGAGAGILQPRAQELARRLHQRELVTPAAPPVKAEPSYVELIETRLGQGKLLEPDNDNAFYYLGQLAAKDPQNAGLAQLQSEVQTQIIARAAGEFDAGRIDNAKTLLRSAATLGATPQWNALNDRISAAPRGGATYQPVPEVDIAVLHATKPPTPQYPVEALAAGTEGWVDLSFVVAADGKVGNITVLDAQPPRVFDRAARDALARARYEPIVQNGRAIAVSSRIHVAFRLADR